MVVVVVVVVVAFPRLGGFVENVWPFFPLLCLRERARERERSGVFLNAWTAG